MNDSLRLTEQTSIAENELDIRMLCKALWCGKYWIVGIAMLCALIVLGLTFFMTPKWSTQAVTDKPTLNILGQYYSQQKFLQSLDKQVQPAGGESQSISDAVYDEFIKQLASYDTRRNFWLKSDYYAQRRTGDAQADAQLLDKFVENIQFKPRNDKNFFNDTVKLSAQTASDANRLLRQYIGFANQRAVLTLNQEVSSAWQAYTSSIKSQIKQQEAVALALYQHDMMRIEQALKVAQQSGINLRRTNLALEQLSDADLFMLGTKVLQAKLESLQKIGANFDLDYEHNKAILATLSIKPKLDDNFQTYRYLRTPEEPVKRDSPRRTLWFILSAIAGALIGAGVALLRRPLL